jgi:hypothetical protein
VNGLVSGAGEQVAMGTITTIATTARVLPTHQARWTHLGNVMGLSDTEPKRTEIRAGLAAMVWVEPDELADVLALSPVRFLVSGLFYRRVLHRAAVIDLPSDWLGRDRRLIGLESVAGDRYVLLSIDYEAVDVLHETPCRQDKS